MTGAGEPTTLVCLPFAGAGASFYHPWSRFAGDRLRVLPARLPGRERLIDVEPHRDAHVAAAALLTQVVADLGDAKRVALFGHSLGAVLAYELAHRLLDVPGVEVVRLFASGSPQPHVQRDRRATGLDDDEFVRRVREFAGFSDDALDDPEMRELILPTLRADVEMHEGYVPSTTDPLPVPVTALRGADDELVTSAEAAGWATVTTAGFELVEPPGGHMYLADAGERLVHLVDRAVNEG
ncbi:thioesterase II family protein [Actinosynnema sp. NPDC059335]|uniref:thioesterase II family protein n=1 Tax=Actinosynnema sp. NPDC059335 TaxID=3346804 RepID=UPI0036711727